MNYLAKIRASAEARAAECTIQCTQEENRVRPEWADDADINKIIDRLLSGQQIAARPVTYGLKDDTLDLQQVLAARDAIMDAYDDFDEETRSQVTLAAFMRGLAGGEIPEALKKHPEPEKTPKGEETPKGEQTPKVDN